MKDRFRFRVWNNRDWDDEYGQAYYDAEKTYDYLQGKPRVPASSFGDLLDDDQWIVEQCTGLKDKNGRLIYEGDIILKIDKNGLGLPRYRNCRVFWYEKWLAWAIETVYGDVYMLHEYDYTQYEVIGNIHEDPELLEGGV